MQFLAASLLSAVTPDPHIQRKSNLLFYGKIEFLWKKVTWHHQAVTGSKIQDIKNQKICFFEKAILGKMYKLK